MSRNPQFNVGLGLVWGNLFKDLTDEQMYMKELEMGIKAEEIGFDSVWSVEHHFDSYAMCPSNFQALTYIAARTSTIQLGLGAVILPWNDPLRVVENVAMLDIMSGGRVLLGFGRGLAKKEYVGFRQDMAESRERFDEASRFVVEALETGFAEFDGKYYKQPRVEIRPRPPRSFEGRLYGVAMSPDSVIPVAEIGATMAMFVQGSIESALPAIQAHRDHFFKKFGRMPNPVAMTDFTYCHEDAAEAERGAREHLSAYFMSVMRHYELMGTDFEGVKGYDSYDAAAKMMRDMGKEAVLEGYIQTQNWGTPEQILEKFKKRMEVTGGYQQRFCCSFGAMPYEKVEASMRLLGKQVLPEMRRIADDMLVPA
ncbi:LLM class flavin-dependent oxidoreductase [Sphingomonas oligophenolica]|uniref:LLM class flavin-dependent oxidoreductase n=1 Tax=Sphingomonas oligophenolica TaxID=301154 RepID=A0ABU9YBR5_9SPHN